MKEKPVNNKLRSELIKHQTAVKATGVALAIVLMLTMGLIPLVRGAGSKLKKIKTREAEAAALSKKITILSQIDQEVLKQRSSTIKTALPDNKDVVSYLRTIDGLSKELGLSFGGITISPGQVSGNDTQSKTSKKNTRTIAKLNVLDTDIKINGNKDGIYAFLRQVEETLPLMQISNVSITSTNPDQYSMSLSLGMLWAPSSTIDLKGAITLFNEKEEAYFQKLNKFRTYDQIAVTSGGSVVGGKNDLFESNFSIPATVEN